MKVRKLIQSVTAFGNERMAKLALPGIMGLEDCIAARVIGDGRLKPFSTQAFFLDFAGSLPDGMRRVHVPDSLIRQCGRGKGYSLLKKAEEV
jgi:hypothetical protein